MTSFETKHLPASPDAIAPDGMAVRLLLALEGGSFAHFELAPGQTSIAVTHRTVEEIWYFVRGRGEMWRSQDGREDVVPVGPGSCLTIPLGCRFQLRATGVKSLAAVAVTMPPWPGPDEAFAVEGRWVATVPTVPRP